MDSKHIAEVLQAAGFPVRPCGLNADWSCRAWHLGPSRDPNQTNGDYYLLDDEDDDNFTIARRYYNRDNDDISVEPLPPAEEVKVYQAIGYAQKILQPGLVPLFKFLCAMSKKTYSVTLFREAEVTIDVEALDREDAVQEARDNVCGLSFPKDWDTESLYVTQVDGEEYDE